MKLTYRRILEIQMSLMEFNKLKLPIACSLDIAKLSNHIDIEVGLFTKTRDKLIRDFAIKPSHTEQTDVFSFTSTVKGEDDKETQELKKRNLTEFAEKFMELLESETSDIPIQSIHLPEDVVIAPKHLKILADFVRIGNGG